MRRVLSETDILAASQGMSDVLLRWHLHQHSRHHVVVGREHGCIRRPLHLRKHHLDVWFNVRVALGP